MAPQNDDLDSWGGVSDSEGQIEEAQPHVQNAGKDTSRRTEVAVQKDKEEEELERLVFGSKASFREQLFKQTTAEDAGDALQELALVDTAAGKPADVDDLDDSTLFFYEAPVPKSTDGAPAKVGVAAGGRAADPDAPAWEDSDDEKLSVSLASVGRLRKLRLTEAEDVVSGTEYTRRLRQQYLRLSPLPSWAKEAEKRQEKRRRRPSAASVSSDSENEGSDGDSEVDSALPLEKFLRSAGALNEVGSRKKRKLRPEVIDIQKTRDIPDSHQAAVGSLCFHPKFPVLLSSSTASVLYLHHIAPTAHPTPNPMLTSVQARGVPIRRTEFLGPAGDRIFFAGRRRYFHSWDITTGAVQKVAKVPGHKREQKSMERFHLSPCGRYIALIATDRKGGGMLNILDVQTMQWIGQARLESRGGIADFAWWRTGDGLTVLGRDGKVGEYDMETQRFLGVWKDEGSSGGTVIALGGRSGPDTLGDDRWVAVGSNAGILNVYDRHDLLMTSKAGETDIKPLPTPKRCFEQLVTPITLIAFKPDGQLLAFGSQHKKDALRLVHLPSCTVYRNWPTQQTPLGRITAVAFGSNSDVLAVGNDKGKVRLWEIRS